LPHFPLSRTADMIILKYALIVKQNRRFVVRF
jgi:hypothetical protein